MKYILGIILILVLVTTFATIENQINNWDSIIDEHLEIIKQQNYDMDKLIEELEHIKQELEKWEIIDLEVTAYAPYDNVSGICTDGDPTTTSTGTSPSHGTVAVNPKVIPYGTRLYIPGYGIGIAEDTGAAIRARNDLIDIYVDTHKEASAWGRQELRVMVKSGS